MPKERQWERVPEQFGHRYSRAFKSRPEGQAPLDVYRAAEPTQKPLLVFHHLRKTAGTGLRHVISTNLRACELEIVAAEETSEWFGDFWRTAPARERIVCLAGHGANLVLPHVKGRETRPFTLVREPVDRVLSFYHHGAEKPWSLEDVFTGSVADESLLAILRRLFVNLQARELLAPAYDVSALPDWPDHPEAPLWRGRLERVLAGYLVGTQDRLLDSVRVFVREFGWRRIYQPTRRVNRGRPSVGSLDPALRDVIARQNWLDAELYALAVGRLEAAHAAATV